ncbi:MAG: uL13 family ribosomal protein, partial [Candidatus Gracilibacteria bacterium]
IARKPERAIELAIEGMLPKNNLRKLFLKRLKIYGGEEHPHQAQNPQPLEV